MKTIWKGTLTRGGRVAKPFEAEIIDDNGKPTLVQRQGILVSAVSPHEVNAESWMQALVAETARAQDLTASSGQSGGQT